MEVFPTAAATPAPSFDISTMSIVPPQAATSMPAAAQPTPSAAAQSTPSAALTPPVTTGALTAGSTAQQTKEMRITLSPLSPKDVFQPGIMNVLSTGIGGILFPYTPSIAFSQAVNYMDLQLVHSNTDYPAYTRTPSVSISITGKFTVQSQQEGIYALACLHFLRVVSKCYFGETDAKSGKAGLPPPILVLNGYGNYMFNRLRVVLKNHSWSFDDSVDSVTINIPSGGAGAGGYARLPAMFSVTCELMVVQTPQRMRQQFSFDAFASGALMQSGVGWI
jgi:hypothetical protein